ncbi:MAG: class I SAM-dependent methyltransferase [Spirochaetales bacterium]|nr:class I SAM-dependent methyltransferase [Spirochaetales bacterium]
MINELKKQIINEFSSEITQKIYIKKADAGLWGSEEFLIKKYFIPKSTVLDIGCGTGRTSIPLYKLGYDITGLDITPVMIKNAKKIAESKNLKIKYEIGDATKLSYEDDTFDNVLFSFNGWTQIPGNNNRLEALKEIIRILKPDGYFIFTANTRKIGRFTLFWIKQWIKFFILKPLGLTIEEVNFGDMFFNREDNNKRLQQKQYIHIPSLKEVHKQIIKVGFNLVLAEKGNIICSHNTGKYSPTFFVCKN